MFSLTSGREVAGSDATMSLEEFCKKGDMEGVQAALKRGADVNLKNNAGHTGLIWAVIYNHTSVVALLLNTPNIDVNLCESKTGFCALHWAVYSQNNEALKLLLNVPNIDVNIVTSHGWSALHIACLEDRERASVRPRNIGGLKLLLNVPTIDLTIVDPYCGFNVVHWTVDKFYSIEGLKLVLSHPSLTALTLNQKDNHYGCSPVMLAVKQHRSRLEHLEVLVADPRVDLDTTDREGRSLKKAARHPEVRKVAAKAKQRREERRRQETFNIIFPSLNDTLHRKFHYPLRLNRLIREQQRQVSKVLLDGLYDPDSPISKLLGVRTEVVGEIIWQKLVENWQIFPEHMLWC